MNIVLLFGIVGILCGGTAAFIAGTKNRDCTSWFFLGLIFGVFALVAIAAVPKQEERPLVDERTDDERTEAKHKSQPWLRG